MQVASKHPETGKTQAMTLQEECATKKAKHGVSHIPVKMSA